MTDFIEQCRREWERLGVPDGLAEEMAADLAADLREAEAEGVSAEEYLGSGASDPRSFASAWATERGIVAEPPDERRDRRKPPALVAFTAIAALALIVAALLLATGEPKVTLKTSGANPVHLSIPPGAYYLPPPHEVQASAATPIEWILLFLAAAALGFTAWLWIRWNRSRPPVLLA
jgi:hypothetical protein